MPRMPDQEIEEITQKYGQHLKHRVTVMSPPLWAVAAVDQTADEVEAATDNLGLVDEEAVVDAIEDASEEEDDACSAHSRQSLDTEAQHVALAIAQAMWAPVSAIQLVSPHLERMLLTIQLRTSCSQRPSTTSQSLEYSNV